MTTAKQCVDTFPALLSNDRDTIELLLDGIIRGAYREGMKAAAVIAAAHELDMPEMDETAREIARAIVEASA